MGKAWAAPPHFCSPEPEDSVRLDRVHVRENIFAAVCEGFTRPLEPHFVPGERDSLWWGALGVTFILGLRFLTDYLAGTPRISRSQARA